jgi:beta-fructofuranosidase
MYSESVESRKAIGDVDVIYFDGLYHLFHLVLPNHDFIAHAVSTDGINWHRVNNALFIGDPGSFDDLMLWTMAVSPDPHRPGGWRMFYTGLSRKDQGQIQRIGLALSEDLYHWRKTAVHWNESDDSYVSAKIQQARDRCRHSEASRHYSPTDSDSCFPLGPDPQHYEATIDEGRQWVSFRDPFFYQQGDQGWLLVAGRVKDGPIVRRGCVAALQETEPYRFESMPPLHHPGLYDDIEVPSLIHLGGEYYLIGSIREDAKIRYWHTDKIGNPWRSYHDNVLLATGNYAGRVCQDPHGWLVWNFFSMDNDDRTANNLMPPPKRLIRTEEGLLRITTYEGFDKWVRAAIDTRCVHPLRKGQSAERCHTESSQLDLQSEAGFQAFVFDEKVEDFRFRATFKLQGKGKCGIVFRVCPDTHDGYYLSLDLLKGVAQLRRWQTGPEGSGEHMMQFASLQSGYWYTDTPGTAQVQLLGFGSYLELSIDGRVILSLADQGFSAGLLGVYLESAHLQVKDVDCHHMASPTQSDEHLVSG